MYWTLLILMVLALLTELSSASITTTMSSGVLAFVGLFSAIQVVWAGLALYDHSLHESATALRAFAAIFLIVNACSSGVGAMRHYDTVLERTGRTRLLNTVEGISIITALLILH
ncbi:MAG: hypothetical protein ABIM96_02015 [Candidatus Saccharimonas sp.]